MACHIREGLCRLVNFAFGEGGLYRGGPVSKHKAGDFEVQNWEVSRYLVTSITGLLEKAA
jgi:hypothetical protein